MPLRVPPTKRWTDLDALDRLLLFAQSLDEKLFDYTIDSYKASALNLHASAYEISALTAQLREGVIASGALIPVLEEFSEWIKADPVLDQTERHHFAEYAKRLEETRKAPSEMEAIADALVLELDGFYWERLRQAIRSEVVSVQNSRKLTALADSFIVEAELEGYHRKYIFYQVKRCFWWPPVNAVDAIDNFLSEFETEGSSYTFLFKGSSEFLSMRPFSERLGFKILEKDPEIPDPTKRVTEYLESTDTYPVFVESNTHVARDAFSARVRAERFLETLANLHTFHVHQSEPSWHSVALCMNEERTEQILLNAPLSPMRRCQHGDIERAQEEVFKTIDVLAAAHVLPSAAQVFFRALEYHRAALESNTPENQLVDLWAAFEGFLPPPEPDTTRITHYVGNLLPSITLSYAEYVFDDVAKSLERAGQPVRDFVADIIPAAPFFDSAVCLLVSTEREDERRALYEMLVGHPLLRFRCHSLNENYSRSKKVRASIQIHRKRVEWHIQRIYSTRNQIMHTARALPYLDTLVENFHSYLDGLLDATVSVAVQARTLSDIPALMKVLAISEHTYLREMDEDSECNDDNFRGVVFGEKNPLSPYRDRLALR